MVRQNTSGNESTISQQTGTSTTGNNSSNLAETYQTSSGNRATINQQDGSFFNEAKITQQTGIGNRAVIDQNKNSGGAGTGNKATVLQDGAGNINTNITQSNGSRKNEATVTQFGDRNGTEQNGINLGGEVLLPPQTSIEQSVNLVNKKATIIQGSAGARVEKNSASVKQLESTDGEATVRQLSSDNYANIRQTGIYNRSTVLQQGGTNNSVESQAVGKDNVETLEQRGNDNQIYIRFLPQNGGLGSAQNNSNIIDMKQTGDDNRSVADLRSSDANISVTQSGKGNFSRYQVRGDANTTTGAVGVNNDLTVVQDHNFGLGGTGNYFNGAVQGDNNSTNVTQTGEGNRLGTNRTTVHGLLIDGDGNTVLANQNGRQNVANMQIFGTPSNNGNQVTISQTSPIDVNTGNRIGTLNDGDETDERGLEISGNNNAVGLTQNGIGNSINMSIGNAAAGTNGGASHNQVAIVQTGNNNKVGTGGGIGSRGLFITGNDNRADIKQDGGDETQAKQNGDDKLTVRQQNGTSSTAGGNLIKMDQGSGANVATITQNGEGNKVQGLSGAGTFGTQNGGNNEATITQTGNTSMGNIMSLNQTGMGNVIMSTQANP